MSNGLKNLTQTKITVGASSTLILAANPDRTYLRIANLSDEIISIKNTDAAVANEGWTIQPISTNNGSDVLELKYPNIPAGQINGICASGSKVVSVVEGY